MHTYIHGIRSIKPNWYIFTCVVNFVLVNFVLMASFLSIIYMFHKFDEISGIDQQQQDSIPVSDTIASHYSKEHEQNAGNIYVITNPNQETKL